MSDIDFATDHRARAIMRVLEQRGGKMPAQVKQRSRRIDDDDVEHVTTEWKDQFDAGALVRLQRAGLVRRRRIFIEITEAGRAALAAFRKAGASA